MKQMGGPNNNNMSGKSIPQNYQRNNYDAYGPNNRAQQVYHRQPAEMMMDLVPPPGTPSASSQTQVNYHPQRYQGQAHQQNHQQVGNVNRSIPFPLPPVENMPSQQPYVQYGSQHMTGMLPPYITNTQAPPNYYPQTGAAQLHQEPDYSGQHIPSDTQSTSPTLSISSSGTA